MAELQYKGNESVRDASEDLIMISESLRPKESLREATISFLLLKQFHYGNRTRAFETYKYICTNLGEKDKRLEYTIDMLEKTDSHTYDWECRELCRFYNI